MNDLAIAFTEHEQDLLTVARTPKLRMLRGAVAQSLSRLIRLRGTDAYAEELKRLSELDEQMENALRERKSLHEPRARW